jgi:branched-chain amino acid transport system permease protein
MPMRVGELQLLLLQVVVSGLFAGLVYGLISMGLSLIWGVVGMVNFAHSDFMMISMYLTFWVFVKAAIDPLFAFPAIALVMFAIGALLCAQV